MDIPRETPVPDAVVTITHEMRTPLTAIRASLALIRELDGAVSPEAHELLSVCDRNTDRLLRLVTDILDLARIDAKETAIRPVNVSAIVRLVADELAPLVAREGVSIVVDVPPNLAVLAEEDGLRRIFVNLVGNALKHSRGDTVEVAAARNGTRSTIRVRDDGDGIPPDRIDHIFDRFAARETDGGTGLGLSITRALVLRYGGRIFVESRPADGTCFTIELPLAPRPVRRPVMA